MNENESLTDQGKMSIQAAQVIAKQLHDYDNGYSYGLGVTLNQKVDQGARSNIQHNNAEAEKLKYGVDLPVVVKFSEAQRDILPTIGDDELINKGGNANRSEPAVIGNLNRNSSAYIGKTTTRQASLDSCIPVSDIADFLKEQFRKVSPKPKDNLAPNNSDEDPEKPNPTA